VILIRSENEENLRMPLNVRNNIKVIELTKTRITPNVIPSALTSGVSPTNPYLIRYITKQENMIMRMSITKIVKRDKTLFDKKLCIKLLIIV